MKRLKPTCPNSPTGYHVTRIDYRNHETCIHCGFERQNPIEDIQPVYYFDSNIFDNATKTQRVIQAQLSRLVRDYS